MTALVTGGLGFIGSHLVDRLLADGVDVVVIDDESSSELTAAELWPGRPVTVLRVDMRAVDGLAYRPEVVFHLASPVGPVGVLERAGAITGDVVGLSALAADWAAAAGAPLVNVSTSEIYGGGDRGLCAEDMPRVVEAGAWARLEYQTAKLAAEVMLLNRPDVDVRIIRPFNVAGPRQSARGGFVLPRFIGQALRGEPLTVYAPGTQRRALTHVADLVDGIVLAWTAGQPNEDYNLGNADNTCSVAQLAAEVADLLGGEVLQVDPQQLHGPGFREAAEKFPDATKATRLLGWQPSRDRERIIIETAEWMLGRI